MTFENLERLLVGSAAIVDTVLLVMVLERRNRALVPMPIRVLIGSIWLWHVAGFLHLLLFTLGGRVGSAAQSALQAAMTAGLFVLPCATAHGIAAIARPRAREIEGRVARWFYVPGLLAIPAILGVVSRDGPFVTRAASWLGAYVVVTSAVYVIAGIVVTTKAGAIGDSHTRRFLRRLGPVLSGIGLLTAVALLGIGPSAAPVMRWAALVVTLLPLIPALLFGYFVVRHYFLELVVEQSMLYGGVLLIAFLCYHLVLAPWFDERVFGEIDAPLLVTVAVTAIVLLVKPFRQRAAEALRYLLGSRVDRQRERFQLMSRELAESPESDREGVVRWFVEAARRAADVERASGFLLSGEHAIDFSVGDTYVSDAATLADLVRVMDSAGERTLSHRARTKEELALLRRCQASLAIRLRSHTSNAVFLFGRRRLRAELTEETRASLLLLVDQLGASLDHRALAVQQRESERRILQSEKMSMIGLITSSIAHEIKNPLSSIKTLATVTLEDLGGEHAHAEELRLILSEIERLEESTSQLLSFARPGESASRSTELFAVLTRTERVMRHLAKQRRVALRLSLDGPPPAVRVGRNALQEIFFNLLTNAIEAAGEGGAVDVRASSSPGLASLSVEDTGPGIDPRIRDRLFEPFVTTKPQGTGLGLWVVWRRIQECGGEIDCASGENGGSRITIRLPLEGEDSR